MDQDEAYQIELLKTAIYIYRCIVNAPEHGYGQLRPIKKIDNVNKLYEEAVMNNRGEKKMNRKNVHQELCCGFCKANGEHRSYYSTHNLKDNYQRIVCPILFKYVCPTCKVTGHNAHTAKYCPMSNDPFPSITCTKTPRMANGKPRR
ncbi:nanos homolog 3-like [Arctopsyche grandis]|uniref:nanos homolog 3-like n=1 Tax=Arctopsyche grandis TaxID=121162 RepID=UPI00406D7C72